MKYFRNLGVQKKLILIFSIICIFIVLIGAEGIISSAKINMGSKTIYKDNLVSIKDLEEISAQLHEIEAVLLEIVYVRDKSNMSEKLQKIDDLTNKNKKLQEEYESLYATPEMKKIYSDFKNDLLVYRKERTKLILLVKADDYDEAVEVYNSTIIPITDAMVEQFQKLIDIEVAAAKEANANNIAQFNKVSFTIIICSVISFLIIIIMAYILTKNIMMPLKKIKDFASRLSNYDFSAPITITRKDEFGQTGLALNTAQENVSSLIKVIMENSQEISASSEELSATVQELSSKAETIDEAVNNISIGMQDSSAASEEISASMEEVDSSINELSSKAMEGSINSNQSKERAMEVKNNSRKAIDETRIVYTEKQEMVKKVIEAGKVVDNIKVMADTIGNIANQTSLLSLNAAIESARAGEQGRGFAVVSEEVRKLSEQSAEAVTKIQETINKVQDAFKSSIDTSSDMLGFINTQVNEQFDAYGETGDQYYNDADFVSKMSEEIAAMSEEITSTVGQVNEAVQNMAEASQKSSEEAETIKVSMNETTKAIEQVAITAESQAELAQKLNEIVLKFKI